MTELPNGYYAIPDPMDPDTMTYWRINNGRVTPWPTRAKYGPKFLRKDAPPKDDRDAYLAYFERCRKQLNVWGMGRPNGAHRRGRRSPRKVRRAHDPLLRLRPGAHGPRDEGQRCGPRVPERYPGRRPRRAGRRGRRCPRGGPVVTEPMTDARCDATYPSNPAAQCSQPAGHRWMHSSVTDGCTYSWGEPRAAGDAAELVRMRAEVRRLQAAEKRVRTMCEVLRNHPVLGNDVDLILAALDNTAPAGTEA
jgi:hypothetical protein